MDYNEKRSKQRDTGKLFGTISLISLFTSTIAGFAAGFILDVYPQYDNIAGFFIFKAFGGTFCSIVCAVQYFERRDK